MGFPSPAQNHVEKSRSLDEDCIQHPAATYFMHADSACIRAEILKDVLLVIDCDVHPKHGPVVIAQINGQFAIRNSQIADIATVCVEAIGRIRKPVNTNKEIVITLKSKIVSRDSSRS